MKRHRAESVSKKVRGRVRNSANKNLERLSNSRVSSTALGRAHVHVLRRMRAAKKPSIPESAGVAICMSAGVVRTAPDDVMNASATGISPGITGSSAMSGDEARNAA